MTSSIAITTKVTNQEISHTLNKDGQLYWDIKITGNYKTYPHINLKEGLIYKTTKINNRRYLGNKYKLLDFIKEIVAKECEGINSVADVFAGTGAVASAFIDKKLIVNDLMYSNYICHIAWFSSQKYSKEKIIKYLLFYNNMQIDEENYMTKNFSNTFFSKKDCSKIGYVRENIEKLYNSNEINERERALLITSLLYGMDKIANTCGHYDAYRKNAKYEKSLELRVPIPDENLDRNNQIYNMDANLLLKKIEADLVYIDPPYNSRQYCDAYHLLENVARWEKPKVSGIARKMDRTNLKSDYCTKKATKAFEELIEKVKSKYILISYNNMATKGNDRSNAKIKDKDILRILEKKGEVTVYSKDYKAFTTGKSNIKKNQERLFLCKSFYNQKNIIKSPLNYTGGKFKLLPQILPHFPKNINTFIDLFCGGCDVGLNVNAKKVVFNDINTNIINIFNTFQNLDKKVTFEMINSLINKYELSLSSSFGYKYYNCNSSDGLANYNKEKYINLRNDFNKNKNKNKDYYYYIMLYVLIIYSFNNQIRFNKNGEFNLPVGKRDFNDKMAINLSNFIDNLKISNFKFTNNDFLQFNFDLLDEDSFLYVDPPYLITCATYNEQGGWTAEKEKALYNLLDKLNKRNIRFALSNVLESKGFTNRILLNWINRNKEMYRIVDLAYNYKNSNYQIKDKGAKTREVLIVNY